MGMSFLFKEGNWRGGKNIFLFIYMVYNKRICILPESVPSPTQATLQAAGELTKS